ncbi:hypothetical protein BC937DRAFT_92384 [Endogone sp. FLAS-F59071]|nr:hypothetical protein BC937DRAFT_92384 [Endogone sp. FLAS-F59071]|eukprot:RUS15487.1 hypothetical protein BC937DRAFT_92384 [Endogone sp. FLAS-F59071]
MLNFIILAPYQSDNRQTAFLLVTTVGQGARVGTLSSYQSCVAAWYLVAGSTPIPTTNSLMFSNSKDIDSDVEMGHYSGGKVLYSVVDRDDDLQFGISRCGDSSVVIRHFSFFAFRCSNFREAATRLFACRSLHFGEYWLLRFMVW